jgi:hypothetical protein
MHFSITQGANGNPVMSWDQPEDISTNIYTTLGIKKRSWFLNPSFGLDLSDIKKVTVNNIDLIKSRIIKALQWLLDSGKAKSITVIVEKDLRDTGRINYKVEAIQANGIPVTVSYFRTVGGPDDDFTI